MKQVLLIFHMILIRRNQVKFLIYGQDRQKKWGWSAGKIKYYLILRVRILLKPMFRMTNAEENLQFVIYHNNDKCLLVLVCYILFLFFLLFFFFLEKAENNRLKEKPKICDIIFLFLLKIGLVGEVGQQINLVSPKVIFNSDYHPPTLINHY